MANADKISAVRKLAHDLRASHHAANLNAQAATMLCKKIQSDEAEKIAKHLAFVIADLNKFKANLDEFTAIIKSLE